MHSKSLRPWPIVLVIAAACVSARVGFLARADANEADTTNDGNVKPGHLKKLLLERLQTLRGFVEATRAAYEADTVTLEQMILANQELLDAELELATALDVGTAPQERVEVYKKNVETAKQLEAKVKALFEGGARGGEAEKFHHAKAARLRMEIGLERELLSTK